MILLSHCSHLNITFIPAYVHKLLSNVFLGRFSLVLQSHKVFLWPEQFNLPILPIYQWHPLLSYVQWFMLMLRSQVFLLG